MYSNHICFIAIISELVHEVALQDPQQESFTQGQSCLWHACVSPERKQLGQSSFPNVFGINHTLDSLLPHPPSPILYNHIEKYHTALSLLHQALSTRYFNPSYKKQTTQ